MARSRELSKVLSSNTTLVYSTDLISNLPIGTIMAYSASASLTNWLICDGSAVSRTTYSSLFSLIGTAYGVGNNSTTFNLPDLRGKTPVGFNSSESEFNSLGKTGGSKTHTLTTDQIPSHLHNYGQVTTSGGTVNATGDIIWAVSGGNVVDKAGAGYLKTANAGGGQAHNILQPYMALNYIIKSL